MKVVDSARNPNRIFHANTPARSGTGGVVEVRDGASMDVAQEGLRGRTTEWHTLGTPPTDQIEPVRERENPVTPQ